MSWDTIVIGTGPGGLTAAVALARAGQRVLVLEQHHVAGGLWQGLAAQGDRFGPGVHYMSELGENGAVRRLYEGLGLSEDLEFSELNADGFEHFIIAGERFDQPRGLDRWMMRLIARFPDERDGIDRYFKTLAMIATDIEKCGTRLTVPEVLSVPFRAPSLIRWGFRTLSALLDSCVRDPMLRAVLSAQSGYTGVAPSRLSLPNHSTMTASYFNGGFYPRGGARSIPRACIKELRRHGGEIRLQTRVNRILVANARTIGVEIDGGETIRADSVVCDRALTDSERHGQTDANGGDESVGVLSLRCAVDMDLRATGHDSGNYWWYRTTDVNGLHARMGRDMPARVDGLFLTITTLKNPERRRDGHHHLEMFTFLRYEPFVPVTGSSSIARDATQRELERELGDKLLEAAENVIPGIRSRLTSLELATPLGSGSLHETHPRAFHCTSKPRQLGPFSLGGRGSVEGLHFCDSSVIGDGLGAASMSGLVAAQRVLGRATKEELLAPADGSLRVYPADRREERLGEKQKPLGARAPFRRRRSEARWPNLRSL